MNNWWLISALCLIISSCASTDNHKIDTLVERTLELSGDNINELTSVLQFFAADDERLEAAKYLIANMSVSVGIEGRYMDSLEANLSALRYVNSTPKIEPGFKDRWKSSYNNRLDTAVDCKVIKADYLISNINHAYDQWKNKPWNKGLDFAHFCDLLLPFRVGNETLSDWRMLYCDRYERRLDSIYHGDDPIEACRHLKEIIYEDRKHILITELSYPHRSALKLYDCSVGNCRDECAFLTYAMRSCGIPVTTDLYLTSPDNFTSHYWTVLYDCKSGKYIPYGEVDPKRYDWDWDGRKKGKVYRTFWGCNPQVGISDIVYTGEECVLDVTSNYFGENKVVVPLEKKNKGNINLGVYYRLGWKAIGQGRSKGSSAIFENIEPGVIYCAIDDYSQPLGVPFIYEKDGSVTFLNPNQDKIQSVSLNRKWPVTIMLRHEWLSDDHIGGFFTAYADNGICDTLHVFSDTLPSNYIPIEVGSKKSYSHVKYTAPQGQQVTISEIHFFADNERNDTIRYIARPDQTTDMKGISFINDNDIITYYKAPEESESVTFSFAKPTQLKQIDFIPRNDDNYVWPGQTYELFYYDTDLRWKSLGRKIADAHSLTYDNVPSDALLLLRNRSKGKAEQVFVWRNNKQMFCIDL